MIRVPHAPAAGQVAALTPRAFVYLCEAREAFADLDAVAADATRLPGRRKLTRKEARALLRRARAALAFLFAEAPPAPTRDDGPRFDAWAE
jgi:hypothetical protein